MKTQSGLLKCRQMLVCLFVLGLVALATPGALAETFKVIHTFSGTSDGATPFNGLIADGGMLFGTTSSGGTDNNGVVFRMTASGIQTIMYNFTGGADGGSPQSSLIRDKAGNLYGTTTAGGASGSGTVFKVLGKKETVLYSFVGGTDGSDPRARLAMDALGNLYGTTFYGGANGNGTVFMLTAPKAKKGAWTETILYSFGTGTDGMNPVGGVSLDADGNLYGMTSAGGTGGYGTVFQLTLGSSWAENTLHNFQNGDDGAVPYGGLIADTSGNFYGAATEGGANGGGTIFELTSSGGVWSFNIVYSVPGWGISGTFRDLSIDSKGNLYGTTHCDGANDAGTVYELSPSAGSWTYTLLYTFTGGSDGLYSFSNPVLVGKSIYGTTAYGGAQGDGVLWKVTP